MKKDLNGSGEMIIRQWQSEIDYERLPGLAAAFSSDIIYQLVVREMSVEISEANPDMPISKTYSLHSIDEGIIGADLTIVAEIDLAICGLATVKYETWNNRANLTGIYVDSRFRGRGIGQRLIDRVTAEAQNKQARCLFVETQNTNYPAIRFYRKMGFEFCGFDTSLYDPGKAPSREAAFYFCKNLSDENP